VPDASATSAASRTVATRSAAGAQLPVFLEADDVEDLAIGAGVEPAQELAKEGRLEGGLVAADEQGERVRSDSEGRREPGERALAGDDVTRHHDRNPEAGRQMGRRPFGANDDDHLVDDTGDGFDRPVEERAAADLHRQLVAAEPSRPAAREHDARASRRAHRGGTSARATTGTPDREHAPASSRSAVTSVVDALLAHSM
jgi:hypothetical protein